MVENIPQKPREEKERLEVAAVMFRDHVQTGINHGLAYDALQKELGFEPLDEEVVSGFITSTGRFVDMPTAYALGKESEQIDPDSTFDSFGSHVLDKK